ncbi:MAG: MBL fold metallo-hydrolase [Planctomycetota bacterium]
MIYRRIYDPALAQASYLVACDETREAVLVDPERDIDRYEREAEDAGVRIVAVAETHLHADFVSGVRAFVASRPVTAYMSGVGSRAPWTAEGPFHAGASMRFLCDGDEFRVGSLRFRARHTPGHTREALSFEFVGEQGFPIALFSGDFLFAGDVGRPDLGFLASGGMTVEESADALRRSLALLDDMPDATLVLPGHGAGSACGKMICRLPETTVGIERVINRPLRSKDDGARFVEGLLRDQPDPPPYFGRVKKANEAGPAVHGCVPSPPRLGPEAFVAASRELARVVVDTREWGAWMDGHLPGSIFAMLDPYFGPTTANYLEPGDEVLLVVDEDRVEEAVRVLYRVGIDGFAGWIAPREFGRIDEGAFEASGCEEISPREANRRILSGALALDVRSKQEFANGHIAGAVHVPFIQLSARIGELDRARPVVAYCRSGNRSARACAFLRRHGFEVANLRGGYWPYAGRGF